MQCPISGKTIDHEKTFPVTRGEPNSVDPKTGMVFNEKGIHYDEAGQRKHSADLNSWKQICVTIEDGRVIFQTHVHGDHVPTVEQLNAAFASIGSK